MCLRGIRKRWMLSLCWGRIRTLRPIYYAPYLQPNLLILVCLMCDSVLLPLLKGLWRNFYFGTIYRLDCRCMGSTSYWRCIEGFVSVLKYRYGMKIYNFASSCSFKSFRASSLNRIAIFFIFRFTAFIMKEN